MSAAAAPWLADLEDDWTPVRSASCSRGHDASDRRKQDSSRDTPSKRRRPLGERVNDATNATITSRHATLDSKPPSIRSATSATSVLQRETLARRAKSSSPTKKSLTLEWRRRVVDGDVGYGDQTDLFGPSGLENIFQSPPAKSSPALPTAVGSSFARFRPAANLPSSPPAWPLANNISASEKQLDDSPGHWPEISDNSVTSKSPHLTTAKHALRQASGQTVGNESFSPVFISKHKTVKGDIDYVPLSSKIASQIHSNNTIDSQDGHRQQSQDEIHDFYHSNQNIECSVQSVPEVSLPDDLPTGTPPVARLGTFVTTDRGGLSDQGSFRTRPLSPSSNAVSTLARSRHVRAQSDLGSVPRDPQQERITSQSSPITPAQFSQFLSPLPSVSPLKLFGAHDTFTNRKLLRRISELEIAKLDSLRMKHPSGKEWAAEVFSSTKVHDDNHHEKAASPNAPSFGDGDLDHHNFDADNSFVSDLYVDERDDEGSPPPDVIPPGSLAPSGWHIAQTRDHKSPEMSGTKRKMSQRSTARSRREQTTVAALDEQHASRVSSYLKRSRSSPCKAPTPKRRRTLHVEELQDLSVRSAHNDDDQADLYQYEDFAHDMSAGSPDSPRRYLVQSEVLDATVEFVSDPPRLQAIQEQLEASAMLGSDYEAAEARKLASKVAAFTINAAKSPSDAQRKRSITTQDFLDEAMQIMAVIRARVGPQNGLTSVQESDEDRLQDQSINQNSFRSLDHTTKSQVFADNDDGWRPRTHLPQDPRIVSQLRRFAEKDDQDVLDATLPPLRSHNPDPDMVEQDYEDHGDSEIRIQGPRHVRSLASLHGGMDSVQSLPSLDEFPTGKTTDSTSTRRSDNVATLAPDTVAHLIPAEVAGMTFDPIQGKWVRTRTRDSRASTSQSVIASDDDPFGQIPDLTVDELNEIQRIQAGHGLSSPKLLASGRVVDIKNQCEPNQFSSSTNPTKLSAFASSAPQPETRATSWGSEQLGKATNIHQAPHMQDNTYSHDFATDHRETDQSFQASFDVAESVLGSDELTEEVPSPQKLERGTSIHSTHLANRSLHQATPRAYLREQELSIMAGLPEKRFFSVSLSVKKPAAMTRRNEHRIVSRYSSPRSPNVYLSDLPEFSVHQIDAVRPSEMALAHRVACHAAEAGHDPYAIALETIVKSLTDAEPQEPHWEDIKHLTLSNKSLSSLQGLDEFCERLQALDVTKNRISHVQGVPPSVRYVDASFNNLSSLTAWHHLRNLHVLDISNNDIDSLSGLCELCHLRDLRANNNHISSLHGILELDGLINVEACGNAITQLDFTNAHLTSLESMDLSHNQISTVSGIHCLPALQDLRLDDNGLSSLSDDHADVRLMTLMGLSAKNNNLVAFDVSSFPNLKLLDLSGNKLSAVTGLDKLDTLDTLALVGQQLSARDGSLVDMVLQQPLHARHVRLSHNSCHSLSLPHTHHSVQSLDLSHCGLPVLPADFGLQLPNLRILNLGFNALKDVRSLANTSHLQQLHISNNRIARLRQTVAALALISTLRTVDARNNPISLGFYAPANETSLDQMVRVKPSPMDKRSFRKSIRCTAADAPCTGFPSHACKVSDKDHLARLDEGTKVRRRVYELLLSTSCKSLERLDGLPLSRAQVIVRDKTWDRLVELGVLKKSTGQGIDLEVVSG